MWAKTQQNNDFLTYLAASPHALTIVRITVTPRRCVDQGRKLEHIYAL